MNNLTTTLVTITGMSLNGNRWKVETDQGNFSFFTTKQDGSATVAAETMNTWNVRIGSKVGIVYSTTQKEGKNPNGTSTGKMVTYKNIVEFKPADSSEVQTQMPIQGSSEAPTSTRDSMSNKDRMMAKMSAWKSACDLYSGSGDREKAKIVADVIYRDITGETPFEEINIDDINFNDPQ